MYLLYGRNDNKKTGTKIDAVILHSSWSGNSIRELKKFTKILLKANEKKTVEFIITKDDLKYYHPSLHRWYLEDGDYNVLICKDAETIVLSEKITICEDYYSQYSKY